jgi:hypothetical protein
MTFTAYAAALNPTHHLRPKAIPEQLGHRFRGLDCAAGKGCVEPFLSRLGGYH